MSNQAYSVSEDLMVGAGVLYFKRSDDTNGWHHLGNVDEFNITNDIEKIDKNSSMNKKRELMASVITSIKPTGTITMTEYNPYNLALGLYGTEGVLQQQGTTLTNEPYTVPSVPGIITLTDADGNRYMDVRNVVVSAETTASPAFNRVDINSTISNKVSNGVGTNDYTFADGGTVELEVGSWNGANDIDIYFTVDTKNTTTGDVQGLVVKYKYGNLGNVQTYTVNTAGLTVTVPLKDANGNDSGASLKFSLNAGSDFTETGGDPLTAIHALLDAPESEYKEGVDYTIDAQELRAGIIKIKDGGKIHAGDTILISATVPDMSYPTVNGGNAGDIAGELLFIGDPNIGGQYNIEGWKVKITPEGDLTGLIGTEFGTFTLTVDFLTDYEHHPECPYYRATMIGRASGTNSTSGVYDPKY